MSDEKPISQGLLLIDGVAIGPCTYLDDALYTVIKSHPAGEPLRAEYKADFTLEQSEAWEQFAREVGLRDVEPPLFDMLFWLALDPARGVMPVVAVDEGSEVITRCARGGGSLGRVWRACSVEVKP